MLTPCIGVCRLDRAGYCEGCHRTADEIARWPLLGDGDRLRLMESVLPARESARS